MRFKPDMRALCAALVAAAAVVLALPLPESAEPPVGAKEVYAGPVHQALRVDASRSAPFQLASEVAPVPDSATTASTRPTLVGIMGSGAYMRSASSGETRYLRPGDVIDGWIVGRVSPREVLVRSGQETVQLRLFTTQSVSSASASQPVPSQVSAVPEATSGGSRSFSD